MNNTEGSFIDKPYRLKWINKTVPKVRAALSAKKNQLQKGGYTKHFMRTADYTISEKQWYKYYESKLGIVTELSSIPRIFACRYIVSQAS